MKISSLLPLLAILLLLPACSSTTYHLPGHSEGIESAVTMTSGEKRPALTSRPNKKNTHLALASENPEIVDATTHPNPQSKTAQFYLVAKSPGIAGLHYLKFQDLLEADELKGWKRSAHLRKSSLGAFIVLVSPP